MVTLLRNSLLIVGAATVCSTASAAKSGVDKGDKGVDKRPNILMVTCEDISLYLGCYGDEVAKSPNLDKFAEEAILFSEMHTTVGVSAPSRFALISGMYPSAMGANYMRTFVNKMEQYPTDLDPYHVILPDEVKGFSEYLREAGYYCINNGKFDYQLNPPLSLWDETGGKGYNENTWILYIEPIKGLKSGDVVTTLATRAGYINSSTVKYTVK